MVLNEHPALTTNRTTKHLPCPQPSKLREEKIKSTAGPKAKQRKKNKHSKRPHRGHLYPRCGLYFCFARNVSAQNTIFHRIPKTNHLSPGRFFLVHWYAGPHTSPGRSLCSHPRHRCACPSEKLHSASAPLRTPCSLCWRNCSFPDVQWMRWGAYAPWK